MEGKHTPRHAAPAKRGARTAYERQYEPEPRREYEPKPRIERGPAPRRRMPVWKLIVSDVLMAGFILCVFAAFHHVIPRMSAKKMEPVLPIATVPPPAPTPVVTAEPEIPGTEQGTETVPPIEDPTDTPQPEEPPVVETPIAWRDKFADKFTDEVITTENSYSSPNISITVTQYTTDYTDVANSVYYVADIYVADVENFRTRWAHGSMSYYNYQDPVQIAVDGNALVSINGDYADNQREGFLVRNGELYMTEQTTMDICVLFRDGTMATYEPTEYAVDDILAMNPWQVWKFGPELLDENGQPKTSFNTSGEIQYENPRTGVGYIEPGHYCFIVVDGRQSHSRGLELDRFAQLFTDLGCQCAYNLDGGASSIMTFRQQIFNRPSNGGRDSGDILMICELPGEEGEG